MDTNKDSRKKFKEYIFAGAGIFICVLFCFITPFDPMDSQGMRILGCTLCAIAFWVSGIFPDWLTAIGLLFLWVTVGKSPFAESFNSFTSEVLWLVVFAFCFAEAVTRSGLFKRISWTVIGRFRPDFGGLCLGLMAVGVLFSPLIPSATAKAVLGASVACALADAMGYEHGSRGRLGLFVSSYIGFSISTAAFLSGSTMTYTLYGSLPEDTRASMDWLSWFRAFAPWLLSLLLVSYVCIMLFLGKGSNKTLSSDYISGELARLGAPSRNEKLAGIMLIGCVALWILEKKIGISAATTAMGAAAMCFGIGLLTPEDLRKTVPWGQFLFLGAALNLGKMFAAYGIDVWIKGLITPVFSVFDSKALVILIVAVMTALLKFVIVSNTACTIIMLTILGPVSSAVGIDIFVLGFVVVTMVQPGFTGYQNIIFSSAFACMRGTLDPNQGPKASLLYEAAAAAACLLSIPWWMHLGYM